MSFDYAAAVAAAVSQAPVDMNKSVKGGGDYTPPAAGVCRLRFISYIEIGKHENRIPGKPPKVEDQVQLTFELSGPKHEPKVLEDGTVIPHRIVLTLNKSLNEKATFFKLFKRMNYAGTATHMAQLLGGAYLGTVVHNTKGEGADKKTYANLKDDNGITIRPPTIDDVETGETRTINVAEPTSDIRCFLWDFASKEMWDSLFIDGEYEEGKTKNVIQAKVQAALNWEGSAMWNILRSGGAVPDVPSGEGKPAASSASAGQATAPSATSAVTAAADPLSGIAQ